MTVSTHVLDAAAGRPLAGIAIRLEHDATVAEARTDEDGRVTALPTPGDGVYRLVFDLDGRPGFYLLSPFAYSTYRGS
jgi:5-hydroxyisourate hydrolase